MDAFWSVFLQNVLMAMAPVIGVAVIGAVIALAKKFWAEAKAANPQAADELEWAAAIAVKAAEQAGGVELAEEKKAYAIKFVEDWLASMGLNIDLDLVDAAIEAAVFSEFNKPELK